MSKVSFKITICVIIIALAISSLFLYNFYNQPINDYEGVITIILKDISNNELSKKDFGFVKEDTLYQILESNYAVRSSDSTYGKVIYDIDDIKTDFQTSYIAIYVNNEYSQKGISYIPLNDGDIYMFKEEAIWGA